MSAKQTRRTVGIPTEIMERLEARCKLEGKPVSQKVSELIEAWIDEGIRKHKAGYVVNTDFMVTTKSPLHAADRVDTMMKKAPEVDSHLVIGVDEDNMLYKTRTDEVA